jgi:hypothetical protein
MASSVFRDCGKYLCSYNHDGGNWSVIITAYDLEDAYQRIAKLGTLKLEGELHATIHCVPATAPAVGLGMRVWCAIANFFRRR